MKDKGNEAYTRIYDPLRSEHERKYSELERYGFEFNFEAGTEAEHSELTSNKEHTIFIITLRPPRHNLQPVNERTYPLLE